MSYNFVGSFVKGILLYSRSQKCNERHLECVSHNSVIDINTLTIAAK